jgi:hypothetical protein
MPTLYNYYDGDNYSFKLINKTIGNSKQTSISLGDDDTKIYTKASGTIHFSTNVNIENNLTIGSTSSGKILNVNNQLGINTSAPYTNVSTHIKNSSSNSITTPPSFNTTDLLVLENATGSFLQLASNDTTTSGIGFTTTNSRNRGSIAYDFSLNDMVFTANSSVMTFDGTNGVNNGVLTVDNITSSVTITTPLINNNKNIYTLSNLDVTSVGSPFTITPDFTTFSMVLIRGMSSSNAYTIKINCDNISGSPSRMRIVYLLVRSNGNYSFNSRTTTTIGGSDVGNIRFPSGGFAVNPCANGQYDMYSFLTNGSEFFCTYAYNYTSTLLT